MNDKAKKLEEGYMLLERLKTLPIASKKEGKDLIRDLGAELKELESEMDQ